VPTETELMTTLVAEIRRSGKHLSHHENDFLKYLLKHQGQDNDEYCSTTGIAKYFLGRDMEEWDKLHGDVRTLASRVRTGLGDYFQDARLGRHSEHRLTIGIGPPYKLHVEANTLQSSLSQFWEVHLGSTRKNWLITTEPLFFYNPREHFFVRYLTLNAPADRVEQPDSPVAGLVECHTYVPSGEAGAEKVLTDWFKGQQKELTVAVSRNCIDQPWQDDLILLGNSRTNRFISSLQEKHNFQLVQQDYQITNSDPKGDEAKIHTDLEGVTGVGVTHALVTRCRGLFDYANATIIAANHGRAAQRVAEFLTTEASVTKMFESFSLDLQKRLPDFFQILFEVPTLNFDLAGDAKPIIRRGV
jgi:hypothetical protein